MWLAGENAPCPSVAYRTLSVLAKPLAEQAIQLCHSFIDLMYVTSPYPPLKLLVVAPHFAAWFHSSALLNAACRVLACVSSRLARNGPSKMLQVCLVVMLGMSFYTTNPTPQPMPLPSSIPITQAIGQPRNRVCCIACSSHSRFNHFCRMEKSTFRFVSMASTIPHRM